jgi:hypothetical protein
MPPSPERLLINSTEFYNKVLAWEESSSKKVRVILDYSTNGSNLPEGGNIAHRNSQI